MKIFLRFFVILFLLLCTHSIEAQQKEMFKQKRERKRIWRRWKPNREAYNPYLKKKAKDKPSARIAKGNRKELRQQKRKDRRQMRRSKKTIQKHSTVR
jgi:hypothetical protein